MAWNILTHTPTWVYLLFIGLCLLGWKQSRTRTVKQSMLLMLPLAMLLYSYFGVRSSFGQAPNVLLLWFVGVVLCTLIGLKLFPPVSAQYRAADNTFVVDGSWWPMLFILAIFLTRYAVGVIASINPTMFQNTLTVLVFAMLYGVLSGAFVVRAISVLKTKHQVRAS
ncbi:hypothetical protein L9G74_10695 [Shewanella sp. C32]|uniref:DUF1453 domain-containing protein n=1 Tax=Shewanella electrica TaxID=515560 RepID=A0ABT2FKR0_9GAMM|nr:DUF6622 family protein [Shewanella electrica]MCH1923691.1 hypothetical protein [Shewanella electrica]MCS4556910.1 hypothetical protein [Shewanella electrica]